MYETHEFEGPLYTGLDDAQIDSLQNQRGAGANGLAHMTVFIDETSFVWCGTGTISVSHRGGYGEPQYRTFAASATLMEASVRDAFDIFTESCVAWLQEHGPVPLAPSIFDMA